MIARNLIPLLLLIVLPDLYLYFRLLDRQRCHRWERALWLLPGIVMVVFTVILAMGRDFVPADMFWLNFYLAILGMLIVPKFVYVLCAVSGHAACRFFHSSRNWGELIGIAAALFCMSVFVYGYTEGFSDVRVRNVVIRSDRLPARFNGFRIAHISDAHVGSYTGRRMAILQSVVDSVMSQHADAIVFTGDLQNASPDEIPPVRHLLSALQAPCGVYSVLGNHDYGDYLNGDEEEKKECERQMIEAQRQMGWKLLINSHETIRRGADSIFIAGMDNDGEKTVPRRADIAKTMAGIPSGAFTLMLEHDPSSWERTILPGSEAQLTLSGHTHGGQLNLFGIRATLLSHKQDRGLYRIGDRYLYVSAGLGGVIPFRFGAEPEVTVYTLYN